ncbi:hypothetical protein SSP531S_37140 [Streptomyces spongiicola]|uniref:Uncharacterized protein n=1 Tax=Streptomyces spongiicola TaxID=1690221 RepID=A0A388T020_9ACTN|nr:hypothetical protein SSP531S_37140 [Streptomyces spongiicola]
MVVMVVVMAVVPTYGNPAGPTSLRLAPGVLLRVPLSLSVPVPVPVPVAVAVAVAVPVAPPLPMLVSMARHGHHHGSRTGLQPLSKSGP